MTPHRTSRRTICATCTSMFDASLTELRRGRGKFCSQACYKARRIPLEIRLWRKVTKTDTCWIWTGAIAGWGHGRIQTSIGQIDATHRVSWRLHFGEIPDGLCVLHKCDNPPCVRPDHLFLGTLKDNTQDMLKKERHLVKLSDEQQQEMRDLFAAEKATYDELSRRFGVCKATTWKVLAGKYSPGLVKAPKN